MIEFQKIKNILSLPIHIIFPQKFKANKFLRLRNSEDNDSRFIN